MCPDRVSSLVDRKALPDRNLKIIFCVTLMAVMGVSSITPAFPQIARELGVSAQSIGLLIAVFTFPGVLLTPVLGIMADRYGRKRVLVPSLVLFAIAGSLCGFARDYQVLLALRLLQGVGAASLGSLNVTIIGDLYSGKDRTSAMGYNAGVLSLAVASYPLIGGGLAALAWYYPFFLPILAIPVGWLVLFGMDNPEPKSAGRLSHHLGGALKSLNRQVAGLFAGSLFTFIILFGAYLVFFPFLIKQKFDGSPMVIGVLMSAMSVTTAVTASRLGKLTTRYSEKTLMKTGFVLYAAGLLLMPLAGHLWMLLIPALVFGVGHGVNLPSLQSLLAEQAPDEHRAVFMSMNSLVLRLGQTLGPLLLGVAFAATGLTGTFIIGSLLAIVAFFIITFTVRG